MKQAKAICDLQSCYLCRQSLPEWLPAIAAQKKNILLKKGQSVFSENDAVTGIYFVYKGIIKVHKRWDTEKELITRFAKQGDIIGHLGLGNASNYPISATAIEPSVVCYIDLDFFEATLKVNTNLTYDLMQFFANELQESQKRMRDLAHMSVKARIAQAFLTLYSQFGIKADGTIAIEISRQDIASFAGTTYETLFKVVNDFTANKIVKLTGRNIQIIAVEKLLAVVAQDHLKG